MGISKKFLYSFFLLFSSVFYAQDFTSTWEEHFSYLEIQDLTQGDNKIYAAAQNAIFVYDVNTQEIETISTINGLSGEEISTIYYSTKYNLLMIGYANGLIEIVYNGNEIFTIVDILKKTTIPPTQKGINNFKEDNGLVYISADFGISVYDLEALEFGDSYFIGVGNTYISVNQTEVFDGDIYAACGDNNGLRKATISNPNLIDSDVWQTIGVGSFQAIEKLGVELYAIRNIRTVCEVTNNAVNALYTYSEDVVDVESFFDKLIITTATKVDVYEENLVPSESIYKPSFETIFSSVTIDELNNVYIGTVGKLSTGLPGYGVLKTVLDNSTRFEEIHPEGPLLNKIFSLNTPSNEVWAVYGGYSSSYNFSGGIARSGISHFKNNKWLNTPYNSIADVVSNPNYLSKITVNPLNTNQVFISSYSAGLIEINRDEITTLYNKDNSTITPFSGNLYLTLGGEYDTNGALWLMNGRVEKPLNKFENNNWQSYSFDGLIKDPLSDELGYSDIVIDANGTKWVGGYFNGLIGYDTKSGTSQIKSLNEESQNMPDQSVTALALDNSNQLWIGTARGLRVLYNTSSFFTDSNVQVSEIIILDDGIAKELLAQEYISSIEVDGSNNKWIGTIGSGVYYFSSDGQETIYHFTKDNSPIPSNNISDISIDNSNGKVFIATESGLVAFYSGSSETKDNYNDAYVYPNPVRPTFNIVDELVKIKGLTDRVNIKITDIEGNLVAEAQANVNSRFGGSNLEIDGGTAFWNGKNLANNVVRSGVYLIMLSDTETFETKVLKLMVIR